MTEETVKVHTYLPVTQQVRTRPPVSQVARGVVALKDPSIARMAGDDQASGARAALLLLAFTLNPGSIGWRIAGKGPLRFSHTTP